jgi:tetratricopeptide (TPR) repeat protein
MVPPEEGTRMLGLFRRSVYQVIRGGNLVRRLLPAPLRSVQLTTMGVLLALVADWGAREVSRILASPTPVVSRSRMSALATADAEALARCERSLEEARRRMWEDPKDGSACLDVASLEMRRGDWLALLAEETRSHASDGATGPESRVNPQWRQYYLRGDPAGTLGRAAQAAEAALRVVLDSPSRSRALLLLAAARAAQGNYHGEAEALAEAVRREPGEARLWLRLSEAYGRAHRFARAAEARELGLSLPGGNGQALAHPDAGVPQEAKALDRNHLKSIDDPATVLVRGGSPSKASARELAPPPGAASCALASLSPRSRDDTMTSPAPALPCGRSGGSQCESPW